MSSVPTEFFLDDLKEGDAKFIHQKWPSLFVPTIETLEVCIKFNPTTGLYRKSDNRLLACAIVHENGLNGNLNVDAEFRRQKLGKYVLASHSIKIQKEGKLQIAAVEHDNKVANNFLPSVGGSWTGNISAIKVRANSKNGLLSAKL